LKSAKRTGYVNHDNRDISPIDNPTGAVDFYMPLPDDVYEKWKKK
jgi:hypothetical protein